MIDLPEDTKQIYSTLLKCADVLLQESETIVNFDKPRTITVIGDDAINKIKEVAESGYTYKLNEDK